MIILIGMLLTLVFTICIRNAEMVKLIANMALLLVLTVLGFFVAGPGLILIAVYIRGHHQ